MIYVDAFGGDYAPDAMVKGAVLAVKEFNREITLVGHEEKIKKVFEENKLSMDKISIIPVSYTHLELFIIMFMGYIIVKSGVLKSDDSKSISAILVYLCLLYTSILTVK